MVREVADRGGRLDYVVSNAAVNPFMAWDETTVEDFDLLFETNVRGTWVVCTEGAKQMIREGHGGAICCVSSISAHVGAPGPDRVLRHQGRHQHAGQGARPRPRRARHPGQRGGAGLGEDEHERADDGRPGGADVLHRAGRPAPRRRARGTGRRHRLAALRRCQLRHLRDAAGRWRLHRERRTLRRWRPRCATQPRSCRTPTTRSGGTMARPSGSAARTWSRPPWSSTSTRRSATSSAWPAS